MSTSKNVQKFLQQLQQLKQEECFPKKQLVDLCIAGCPSLKEVLETAKYIMPRYHDNFYLCWEEVVLLLYMAMLKGSIALVDFTMDFITNVLVYQISIIGVKDNGTNIIKVYNYLSQLFGHLVPVLFTHHLEDKIIKVLERVNREPVILLPLSVVFEGLLVLKVKQHLTKESCAQFEEVLSELYPPHKLPLMKQTNFSYSAVLTFYHFAMLRDDQSSYQLYDIVVHQHGTGKKPSEQQPQNWAMESYHKPRSINLAPLSKMLIIQLYTFFNHLEVYSSSPKIQVLDDLIPNQELIEVFCRFLLGDPTAQTPYRHGNFGWKGIVEQTWEAWKTLPPAYRQVAFKQLQKKVQ